jgi:hypothetical protein
VDPPFAEHGYLDRLEKFHFADDAVAAGVQVKRTVTSEGAIKERRINIGGKATVKFGMGDRLVIHTPGGGGWGEPGTRRKEIEVVKELPPSGTYTFFGPSDRASSAKGRLRCCPLGKTSSRFPPGAVNVDPIVLFVHKAVEMHFFEFVLKS